MWPAVPSLTASSISHHASNRRIELVPRCNLARSGAEFPGPGSICFFPRRDTGLTRRSDGSTKQRDSIGCGRSKQQDSAHPARATIGCWPHVSVRGSQSAQSLFSTISLGGFTAWLPKLCLPTPAVSCRTVADTPLFRSPNFHLGAKRIRFRRIPFCRPPHHSGSQATYRPHGCYFQGLPLTQSQTPSRLAREYFLVKEWVLK